MIGHIKSGQWAILIILPSLSQSAWNTRFYFGHQKPCMDNNQYYYPYRAFGGQNKIVYSKCFVTRRAIILSLPGQ